MAAGRPYIRGMSRNRNTDSFSTCLETFNPTRSEITRSLALYSAAITNADEQYLQAAAHICLEQGAVSQQLYEVVLQSYLFLGFPRMLQAAESLVQVIPTLRTSHQPPALNSDNLTEWLDRGRRLCRKVYDSNYQSLKNRVESMAPEIFLWMELEGYGKVLSRPGLSIVDRELVIVACLMMENRSSQLHSHIRGALNVGAPLQLLRDVVSDLAPAAPDGHATALDILHRLEEN